MDTLLQQRKLEPLSDVHKGCISAYDKLPVSYNYVVNTHGVIEKRECLMQLLTRTRTLHLLFTKFDF